MTLTDKWDGGYMPTYLRIAAELGPAARVCELGVYHGDSLRMWRELFPFGEITGVDVNPDCEIPDGCRFVMGSQEDSSLPAALGGTFDLIVDDASHVGTLTYKAFANLWPLVNPGGYYVIEDWMIGLPEFKDHPMHDPGMLATVAALLPLLTSKTAVADEVTYRYGLCVIHKRTLW